MILCFFFGFFFIRYYCIFFLHNLSCVFKRLTHYSVHSDIGSASNYIEVTNFPMEPHLDSRMHDEHIASASVAKRSTKWDLASYSIPTLTSDAGYSMPSCLGDPAYAELTVENEGHAMPYGHANLYQETAFPNLNQSNPSLSSLTASDLHNRRFTVYNIPMEKSQLALDSTDTDHDNPYIIGEMISNPLFAGFSTNPEGRHQMQESTVDSDIAAESKISFVDRIPRIVKRGLLALILILIAIAVAVPVSMRSNSSNLLDSARINASASNSITVNVSNDTSVTPTADPGTFPIRLPR